MLLTAQDVAKRLRCSLRHVRKLTADGVLSKVPIGPKAIRIPLAEVEAFEVHGWQPGTTARDNSGSRSSSKRASGSTSGTLAALGSPRPKRGRTRGGEKSTTALTSTKDRI
jgi:excisionase family DNA binding protein